MYLLSSGLVSAEHQLMALKLLHRLHVSPQLWVSLCRTSADGSEAPAAAAVCLIMSCCIVQCRFLSLSQRQSSIRMMEV